MRSKPFLLAGVAGLLATVALWRAPWWAGVPMLLYPPYIPIDLRLVLPALVFVAAHGLAQRSRWPSPAVGLPLVAVLTAAIAHLHASAVLDFVGIGWAEPGVRIDLFSLGASLASLLIALAVGLGEARDRFGREMGHRGLPEAQLEAAGAAGSQLIEASLATAGLGAAVLGLALRILDQFLGGRALPVPELFALAVVLALGFVWLGLRARDQASA